jgi:ferritin
LFGEYKVPNYDLGTLVVDSHDVKKLTQALDIPDHRFEDIVDLARRAWEHEDTISESIEYIAQNASGSELVLALVFFGRFWEDNQEDEE